MAEDKRQGWIVALQVGEKVGYGYDRFGRTVVGWATISNVTPTGRITLDLGGGRTSVYDPTGRQTKRGDNRLIPMDEARAIHRRNKAQGALQDAVDALVEARRNMPVDLTPEAADEIRGLVERATALLRTQAT